LMQAGTIQGKYPVLPLTFERGVQNSTGKYRPAYQSPDSGWHPKLWSTRQHSCLYLLL